MLLDMALVARLIQAAQPRFVIVRARVAEAAGFFQGTRAHDEEPHDPAIDHADHRGLLIVEQSRELEQIRHATDRDLVLKCDAGLDDLKQPIRRTREDGHALR